jgi:hypothetical protein
MRGRQIVGIELFAARGLRSRGVEAGDTPAGFFWAANEVCFFADATRLLVTNDAVRWCCSDACRLSADRSSETVTMGIVSVARCSTLVNDPAVMMASGRASTIIVAPESARSNALLNASTTVIDALDEAVLAKLIEEGNPMRRGSWGLDQHT